MAEYIERETLLHEIELQRRASKASYPRRSFVVGDVITCIRTAPTADVAPVVHGYWIEVSRIEHDYETEIEEKCSECGRHVYRYDTQPQDNHCPTCGADMGF